MVPSIIALMTVCDLTHFALPYSPGRLCTPWDPDSDRLPGLPHVSWEQVLGNE